MPEPVNTDLGSYLRRMRERLQPAELGLVSRGSRRVPGLRREEVAALAGVSSTYYTRLEQARTAHASPEVLSAIARALDLNAAEEAHLLKIGTTAPAPPVRPATTDELTPQTRMLVNTLADAAVAVLNFRCDILAWNSLFHKLFAAHLDFAAPDGDRPNVIKLNFLDDNVRALYADWPSEAQQNVSYLRYIAGDHRHDPRLAELIGELTMASEEFANLWVGQTVGNCTAGTKTFRHPTVGEFELMYQSAELGDGTILKIYHAEPDSAHEAAAKLLATDLG